jgi:hypothetical protein
MQDIEKQELVELLKYVRSSGLTLTQLAIDVKASGSSDAIETLAEQAIKLTDLLPPGFNPRSILDALKQK